MESIKIDKIATSIKEALIKLKATNIHFYVVGGLLCQSYLKEHARYTKDIDIIFDDEISNVKKELSNTFGKINFFHEDENELFYEPSFTSFVKIGDGNAQIEGKRVEFFNEVETEIYELEGVEFTGVGIEYVIAEKLVSLLCELARPYKHLVDIYSFTQIDQTLINFNEVKKYISLINKQENKIRKNIGLDEYIIPNQIKKDKLFISSVITPTLQSGYNICKEEMIDEINRWLSLWHFCD